MAVCMPLSIRWLKPLRKKRALQQSYQISRIVVYGAERSIVKEKKKECQQAV